MGTKQIGLEELTDVMVSVKEYQRLATWIGQTTDNKDTVKPWYEEAIKKYGDSGKYIGEQWYRTWCNIDMHVVNQIWGSTACGWGGIGGSAMTSAYSVVLVNKEMSMACVYWSGKLAYIVHTDDKWKEYVTKSGYRMPGRSDVSKVLNIIYIHTR